MQSQRPCTRLEMYLQPLEPQEMESLVNEIWGLMDSVKRLKNMSLARRGDCLVLMNTTLPRRPAAGPGVPLPQLKLVALCDTVEGLEGLVEALSGIGTRFYVADLS